MGNLATSVWKRLSGLKEARIFIAGLDAAGKSTILYTLSLGPQNVPAEGIMTIPTIGFNVEKVKHNKVVFTMWDGGHNSNMRALVRHYYQGTQALIFVVDVNDQERISENREAFKTLLRNDEFNKCPILIYANKQDLLEGIFDAVKFAKEMGLNELPSDRKWYI